MSMRIGLALPYGQGSQPGVPAAPVNAVPPLVSGDAEEGSLLSCSSGSWSGYPAPTFTYQWRTDAVNIGGATASTYQTVTGDVGAAVDCVVTATNTEGFASQASSNAITVTEAPGGEAGDSLALFNQGGATLLHLGMI